MGGHAIADGFLRFIDQGARNPNDYLEGIRPEMKAVVSKLSGSPRTLGTWEVKSLTVGDEEVMMEIYQKALRHENFEWKVCHGECGRPDHDDVMKRRERRTLDPSSPPWELPGDDKPIGLSRRRSQRLQNKKHSTPEALNHRESSPESDAFDSPGPSPSARNSDSPIKRKASEKADSDSDYPDTRSERRFTTSHSIIQQVRKIPFACLIDGG
jgi:hypothetical protein